MDRPDATGIVARTREGGISHPGMERRKIRWSWGKSLVAAAVVAMLLVVVTQAMPQTLPEVHRPYVVLSEFARYAKDGSAEVQMYSTSYNDQYGREIMVARHLADNPVGNVVARTLDSLSEGTGTNPPSTAAIIAWMG